jgi:SAM-dependent methyltransferase
MMDRDDNSREDLDQALREIERVNRHLGGSGTLLDGLKPILATLPREQPVRLLDVGTGSADLPLAISRLARRIGRELIVTAVDRDPVTAAIARRAVAERPEIDVVVADAADLPFAPRSFDIVTASMFLHHFPDGRLPVMLRSLAALSRRALLVNDLRRHRLPWLFIRVLTTATRRHPMFAHDAPLSVLRGFTPQELQAAALEAGAGAATVRRRWPFRLLLTIETAGAGASG